MLFNSLTFALFFCLVFALYVGLFNRNLKLRNWFIWVVSYVFYGWWDVRFLTLIALSTLIDYLVAIQLDKTTEESKRKGLLAISLTANLGILVLFKYFGFFAENLQILGDYFGYTFSWTSLHIVLPVGISFYTFQTLSYTIDVYRKQLPATQDFVAFSAYVSYFPQLVAGPIERAPHILPQFERLHTVDYDKLRIGFSWIVWGLFKKVVVADNLAVYVNRLYESLPAANSLALLFGALCFAFQIYCDFSGYSDIARGTAKCMGFDLMQNFRQPYFATSLTDFWRRWHISLSTWFRDYVYVPLGGNRSKTSRNLLIVFLLSGLWHGANWTFVLWGGLHGLLLIGERSFKRYFPPTSHVFLKAIGWGFVFTFVCFSWVLFRCPDVASIQLYFTRLFTMGFALYSPTVTFGLGFAQLLLCVIVIGLLFVYEWRVSRNEGIFSWANLFVLCLLIFLLGRDGQNEFIYFQF